MKRFLAIFVLLMLAVLPVRAQLGPIQEFCNNGGNHAITSGLPSNNYLQGNIPQCTVSVFYHNTTTLAPIFSSETANGTVQSVQVTDGGSYSVCPTGVTFTGGGGSGAAGTVSCTLGAVVSVAVTNPGSGYSSPPTVAFTGGTGSEATATAVISGSLTNPFTAKADGGFLLWAATNQGYDVVMSGGMGNPNCTTAPLCYTQPVALTDVFAGGSGSGGSSPSPPSYSVQAANSGATGLTSDSAITITPSTHTLTAQNLTASANKTISIIAPPYDAYCDLVSSAAALTINTSGVTSGFTFATTDIGKMLDGTSATAGYSGTITAVSGGNATLSPAPGSTVTLVYWEYGHNDQTAIQSAFNAGQAASEAIQFPAGACLTGTITWMGESFFGAGINQTTVQGLPGEDVFATPDSAVTLPANTYVRDMSINVDSSVNAAATAVGGNNTFPNRISGTAGGTTPIPSLYGGPPAPGGAIFNPAVSGNCGGSMSSGSPTLTVACAPFNGTPPYLLIGTPVTVDGAGSGGTNLVTTVSAVASADQLTLATIASTTVSSVYTTVGTGIQPPWYFGNCGLAMPGSNGAALSTYVNGWLFRNLQIVQQNGAYTDDNYTCGIFIQTAPNALRFENVSTLSLYGGIIEAPPAENNTSYFAWTPDTSSYKNVDLKFDLFPMIWYNGAHRIASGLNIYGGVRLFSSGLFQFEAPLGTAPAPPTANISSYYNECSTYNSGELARFSGEQDNITSGALAQCYGTGYVNWVASYSKVNAQISSALEVSGSHNSFTNTYLAASNITDSGLSNSIATGTTSNIFPRDAYADRPREPLNSLDAGFLLTGNQNTPFTSGSDLLLTCPDFNFAFNNGLGGGTGCTNDPGDTSNIAPTYFHADSTDYPSGYNFGPASQGDGPNGKLLMVGDRIPQAKIQFSMQSRCSAQCLIAITVSDITTSSTLASVSLGFGTTWSTQSFSIDLSSLALGDQISMSFEPAWGGGVTTNDVAWMGFVPFASTSTNHSPCVFQYYNGPPSYIVPSPICVFDSTSVTQFSVGLPATSYTYEMLGTGIPWDTLSSLAQVPTTFVITMKGASAASVPMSIFCNGSSLTLVSATFSVTTSYANYYLNAPLQECDPTVYPPGNIGLNWVAPPVNLSVSNVQVIPSPLPYPQPTAAGQVPVAVAAGGAYYYQPGTIGLSGTTGSIGGSALALNACSTGTATVTGATTSMYVYGVTPASDPNPPTSLDYEWQGRVTATNTVTVKVCALVAGTPTATTYSFLVN